MSVLKEIEWEYGLTTCPAENLRQGLLFASTTDFYVEPNEIEEWLKLIKEKGLLRGGNTRLRATDEHVFYNPETVDGFTIVSFPQLIVDLLDEGGACKEAAENLITGYHSVM